MTWNQESKTHTLLRQSLSALETQLATQQEQIDRMKACQVEEIEASRHLLMQCLAALETHSKALATLQTRSTNSSLALDALTTQLGALCRKWK